MVTVELVVDVVVEVDVEVDDVVPHGPVLGPPPP